MFISTLQLQAIGSKVVSSLLFLQIQESGVLAPSFFCKKLLGWNVYKCVRDNGIQISSQNAKVNEYADSYLMNETKQSSNQ